MWLLDISHQYSTQQSFQATGCFSTKTVSQLVEDSDFCQMSERMLDELGFLLTTTELTARVATDLATRDAAPIFPEPTQM